VHQIFLVVNGIHILENLKLDELVAKRVYEFAFTMQRSRIYGAFGLDGGARRDPLIGLREFRARRRDPRAKAHAAGAAGAPVAECLAHRLAVVRRSSRSCDSRARRGAAGR